MLTRLTTWSRTSASPAFEPMRMWLSSAQPSIVVALAPSQVSRRRDPVAASASMSSGWPSVKDTYATYRPSGEMRGERTGA